MLGFILAGCAMILVAGCASIGLSGLGEPAVEPRSVSIFVVSTRKGERGVASEAAVANGARFIRGVVCRAGIFRVDWNDTGEASVIDKIDKSRVHDHMLRHSVVSTDGE